MQYSIQWAQSNQQKGFVFFYGNRPSTNITKACFSQWWENSPFVIDNITYLTAEHYMMAAKARLFNDTASLQKVLNCSHPSEAKKIGRQVKNFDPLVWEKNKFNFVVEGNTAKFTQHEDIKLFLKQTQNKILVEASPYDKIWGIGMNEETARKSQPKFWNGENLLGFALMEVRDKL